MKILIAEDDDVSRLLLREFLQAAPAHHTVVEAVNGAEAWAAITGSTDLDACIFDVMMPDISGLDLLTRLRQSPAHAHLPVVMCTSLNDRVTVTRAASLKVTQYLVKPFTRAAVLDRISKATQQPQTETMAETMQAVCDRLQIDRAIYQTLLESLVRGIAAWVGDARKITRWQEVGATGIRANALKGACLNLGVTTLATQFAQAESVCGDQVALAESRRATGGVIDESALGEISSAIDRVEGEHGRLKTFLEARTNVSPGA